MPVDLFSVMVFAKSMFVTEYFFDTVCCWSKYSNSSVLNWVDSGVISTHRNCQLYVWMTCEYDRWDSWEAEGSGLREAMRTFIWWAQCMATQDTRYPHPAAVALLPSSGKFVPVLLNQAVTQLSNCGLWHIADGPLLSLARQCFEG